MNIRSIVGVACAAVAAKNGAALNAAAIQVQSQLDPEAQITMT